MSTSTRCPNSTESGCRCWEHHPGLSAYVPPHAADAYEELLAPLRKKATLRVVTMGLNDEPQCDGSMTCQCERCCEERASRVALGAGRAQFKVRPARRAA